MSSPPICFKKRGNESGRVLQLTEATGDLEGAKNSIGESWFIIGEDFHKELVDILLTVLQRTQGKCSTVKPVAMSAGILA